VLLDVRIVLWRTRSGLSAAQDLCIHRGAQLSPGSIVDGDLVCPYHGFRYAASGACTLAPCTGSPQTALPSKLHLKMLAVAERGGLAWVRLAEEDPSEIPGLPGLSDGGVFAALSWSTSAQRAAECLLDLGKGTDGRSPGAAAVEWLGPFAGTLFGGSVSFAIQPISRARCRILIGGREAAGITAALDRLRPVVESQAPEPQADEDPCLEGEEELQRYRRRLQSLGLG
jgi:nitrite reductase/ring-hydroxylating ferredoxin subunit